MFNKNLGTKAKTTKNTAFFAILAVFALFSLVFSVFTLTNSPKNTPENSSLFASTDGDWQYELDGDNAIITRYTGSLTEIVIPATVGGHTVSGIKGSYYTQVVNNTTVTAVTFAENSSVVSIGQYSFYGWVSGFEIKEFLDQNPSMQSEKLSLKDGDSIQDLLSKIYKNVNESNKDLPINKVLVSQKKISRTDNYEASITLILIGDTHVGKTNFLTRYISNEFHEVFVSTVGIEREIKGVKIDGNLYKIIIWDTAGQERFKSLPIKYYKNVDGVLLLYDVSDEASFDDVNSWIKDVKENANRNTETDLSLFLIANKIDKEERVISRQKGEELAKSLGMKYFEISCKNNMNIHETVARMALECYRRENNSSNEGL